MNAIKSAGGIIVGVGVLIAAVLIPVIFINGALWAAHYFLPFIYVACGIALFVCIFIMLPLSLFQKTRSFAAASFVISSYIFGVALWLYALLWTYKLWGGVAVVVGLFLFGVGIVPVAMLASIFKAQWDILIELLTELVLTFGSRFFGIWLSEKGEGHSVY